MHLCQRFFQSSKYFSNSIFGIAFSSFSDALLMSSMAVKWQSFKVLFSFGNRKKSHRAMSGEYGGWRIVTVLLLAKNSRTSNEVWAGALSWCKSYELFFHKSGCFFRIAPRKRRWTCRQYSLLTVWPRGKNSWCTMPLKIEEHSEHNLHARPHLSSLFRSWRATMPPLGRLRLSFDVISYTLLNFISFFTQNLIQILWSISFKKRKSPSL